MCIATFKAPTAILEENPKKWPILNRYILESTKVDEKSFAVSADNT